MFYDESISNSASKQSAASLITQDFLRTCASPQKEVAMVRPVPGREIVLEKMNLFHRCQLLLPTAQVRHADPIRQNTGDSSDETFRQVYVTSFHVQPTCQSPNCRQVLRRVQRRVTSIPTNSDTRIHTIIVPFRHRTNPLISLFHPIVLSVRQQSVSG